MCQAYRGGNGAKICRKARRKGAHHLEKATLPGRGLRNPPAREGLTAHVLVRDDHGGGWRAVSLHPGWDRDHRGRIATGLASRLTARARRRRGKGGNSRWPATRLARGATAGGQYASQEQAKFTTKHDKSPDDAARRAEVVAGLSSWVTFRIP